MFQPSSCFSGLLRGLKRSTVDDFRCCKNPNCLNYGRQGPPKKLPNSSWAVEQLATGQKPTKSHEPFNPWTKVPGSLSWLIVLQPKVSGKFQNSKFAGFFWIFQYSTSFWKPGCPYPTEREKENTSRLKRSFGRSGCVMIFPREGTYFSVRDDQISPE